MYQEINKSVSYSKNLTLITISTAFFGFACIFLGYLFLPFAAASYASLLLYENKNKRILSYVIPIAIFILNVLFNGFFSLEGITYVLVGVLLYLFSDNKKSKNQTVFWLTFTISVFLCASFIVMGFDANDSASFGALRAYYAGIYDSFKKIFIKIITDINAPDDSGTLFFLFTRENAEDIFHSIILALPSIIIILAFFFTGITFKIFDLYRTRLIFKNCEEHTEFIPTKFLAYVYIAVAILSVFSSAANDILAISINNINNVLLVLFSYFGFKIVYFILKNSRGTAFAILLIATAFVIFSTATLTFLSFIGLFFALTKADIPKEN